MPDEPKAESAATKQVDTATLAESITRKQAPFLRLHFAALGIAATMPATSNARHVALKVADLMLSSARSHDWYEDRDSGTDTAPLDALKNQMHALMWELPDFGQLPEAIRAISGYFQREGQMARDRRAIAQMRAVTPQGHPAASDDPSPPA